MKRFGSCVRVLIPMFSIFVSIGNSQPEVPRLPDGSVIKGSSPWITYSDDALWTMSGLGWREHWTPPSGTTIVRVIRKINPAFHGNSIFAIMLSDGSVYTMSYESNPFTDLYTIPVKAGTQWNPTTDTDSPKEILFDDMYILRYYVWVSRDDGITWKIDTAGLSGATVADIELDTNGNVYATTSNRGLFFQLRPDSIWQKVPSIIPNTLKSVYVDRKNRLYVASTSRKVYYSTNNGVAWDSLPNDLGSGQILSFGDDAAGNIYAITDNGKRLYRSMNGNQPWSQIDGQIKALAVDTTVLPLFNNVSGDSTLSVATAFGLFTSTDQGTNWSHVVEGFEASRLHGFLKLTSGRLLVGTDLGVYYQDKGNSTWTKTYPSAGFLRMGNFQQDNSGNIFCVGGGKIYKSTNGGTSWSLDNAGLTALGGGNFYIDEKGVQHYIVNGSFSTSPRVYVRNGDTWVSDMSGINLTVVDKALAIQSDHNGNLFVSIQLAPVRVLRRPIGGGTWTADTLGLGSKQIVAMTRHTGGDILGLSGKVYRHSGDVWTPLVSPAPVANNTAYLVSVDSNGSIYAAFSTFVSFQQQWKGVYVSKDTGATWQFAGLENMEIKSLVSYGDTTYALTTQGVFLLGTIISIPVLTGPPNGATDIPADTILSWKAAFGATTYQLQISTSNTFVTTFFDQSGISGTWMQLDSLSGNTTYYWRIRATGPGGTSDWSDVWNFKTKNLTGIGKENSLPKEYFLAQNFPNPFNPSTTINFQIPAAGRVTLKIYDVIGREIVALVDEMKEPGNYDVKFEAPGLSTGVYLYSFRAGPYSATRKLLLMK